jgi:hypothetical protein
MSGLRSDPIMSVVAAKPLKKTSDATLSRFLGGFGMLCRVRRIAFLVAALVCAGFASTASAEPAFRDSVLGTSAARALAATTEWGGPTVATNGETVTLYFSTTYPVDPNLSKQWADFMTSLVHGPELASASIHLVPLSEVQRVCGGGALACYSPRTATIVAPGTDPTIDTTAKGILMHEYGHHIAATKQNPPFQAEDYGTKRWASYQNVCARASAGDLFPGAEDAGHYKLNPGEAFAETYRVLNEQKLGLPQEQWNIVTNSLYPDATALSLLEQDVVTPWTANTARKLTAKLNGKVRTRTFAVQTPLDGVLSIASRQSGRASVKVSLLANGSTVKTKTFSRASAGSLSRTICGLRAYGLRVQLAGEITKQTKTTVSLTVSTP